jgi:uncharacterized membrane protein YebE (DUF533 family)
VSQLGDGGAQEAGEGRGDDASVVADLFGDAAAVGSMEEASEMYLVSVLTVDAESFMERAYPDALGNKLNLPADLKTHLENVAKQALAAA